MELGPIIKTLLRNKTRFLLISLEVALTLAIVVNCVNMMRDLRWQIDRPTGIDESAIIVVQSRPFAEEFKEDGYFKNRLRADLEWLRSFPGVRSADAFSAVPLSGSGSSSGFKPLGSDMNTLPANVFITGPQGLRTLGAGLASGRDLTPEDLNDSMAHNVLITQALADRLFPDGDALGKQLQGRTQENPDTVVGVIDHLHGSWPTWRWVTHVVLRPGEPGGFGWGVRYLLRTDPAMIEELIPTIEKRLIELDGGRNVRIETLLEVKSKTFSSSFAVIKMLGSVIVLLVLVTALGIVGITSFSVTERTHQIGTRRALGARRFDILRYFLAENWLITTTGVTVGAGLAYGLNFLLVTWISGVKLDPWLLVYGIALMWLVGFLATFPPAWRGTRISPAAATRNV